MQSSASQKRELREEMRRRLDALSRNASEDVAEAVTRQVTTIAQYQTSEYVGAYDAIRGEIQLKPLWDLAVTAGKRWALPRWVDARNCYEFAAVSGEGQLMTGAFGVREPSPECPVVDISCLDFVLVPGLAFSRRGGRLGRGKGFYDRLLDGVRAARCGVCHGFQLLDAVPVEPWDESLGWVVTPTECVGPMSGCRNE